jgi:adenosylmethionine-8-amino-7-oxononanoate aminotransferase
VAASGAVFESFLADDPAAALMHGPTFMANPLACAAANASLDLFAREPRLDQAAALAGALADGLEPLRGLPHVADIRVLGAIGVVQFRQAPDLADLKRRFLARGTWVRPFGDIVYLTPALTIPAQDLAELLDAMRTVVWAVAS